MMNRKQNEHGMSLVELLVATAILLVGIAPMLSVLLHALKTTDHASKRTIAENLARDLSEEIRSQAFWEPGAMSNSIYYPLGTSLQPVGLDTGSPFNDKFLAGDARIDKLDDVDDYDGWCRGQDCDCTGKLAVLCQDNSFLETYDGYKYNGQEGYPNYQGFTRSVEVFNIFPSFTSPVPTHKMFVGEKTDDSGNRQQVEFNFYDLRENIFPNLTVDSSGDHASGQTRLKVIRVRVSYEGPVTSDFKVEDLNLAVLPVRATSGQTTN